MENQVSKISGAARAAWTLVCIGFLTAATVAALAGRPRHRSDVVAGGLGLSVDMNRADAATLSLLPGVGPRTARDLVAHRARHGRFDSLDQLERLPGLGAKTVAGLTPMIRRLP